MWRRTSRNLLLAGWALKVRLERRVFKVLLAATVKMAKRAYLAPLAHKGLEALVVQAVRRERRVRKALQDRME